MGILAGRIKRRTAERRWVDIKVDTDQTVVNGKRPDNFRVEICWPSQAIRNEIANAVKVKVHGQGRNAQVRIESNDDSKLLYAKEVITGWENLSLAILTEFLRVPIDAADIEDMRATLTKDGEEGFIKWDQENAALVYTSALSERFSDKILEAVAKWDEEVRGADAEVGKASSESSDS